MVCVAAASVACGEPGVAPAASELPSSFRIRGFASAIDASGGRVDCDLEFIVALTRETARVPGRIDYAATHGGHVGRAVVDSTGAGLAIFADVYWPETVVRFFPPDSIEVLLGDSTVANPSRFWRAIALLAGRTVAGNDAPWTCLPLDIDQGGYVDTAGVADGLWWIEPLTLRAVR